jgi:hypothetical protein
VLPVGLGQQKLRLSILGLLIPFLEMFKIRYGAKSAMQVYIHPNLPRVTPAGHKNHIFTPSELLEMLSVIFIIQ